MSSLNKAMLIGHLGADPELRSTRSGEKIANLRLATSERWRDKQSGDMKERTEWHTVVIFNDGLAGVVEKYLKKGSKVYIEGQVQTRKWQDKDGNDRWSTEIVLQKFGGTLVLLDSREGGGGRSRDDDRGGGGDDRRNPPRQSGGGTRRTTDDLDDDIPFSPEWRG